MYSSHRSTTYNHKRTKLRTVKKRFKKRVIKLCVEWFQLLTSIFSQLCLVPVISSCCPLVCTASLRRLTTKKLKKKKCTWGQRRPPVLPSFQSLVYQTWNTTEYFNNQTQIKKIKSSFSSIDSEAIKVRVGHCQNCPVKMFVLWSHQRRDCFFFPIWRNAHWDTARKSGSTQHSSFSLAASLKNATGKKKKKSGYTVIKSASLIPERSLKVIWHGNSWFSFTLLRKEMKI